MEPNDKRLDFMVLFLWKSVLLCRFNIFGFVWSGWDRDFESAWRRFK